MERKLHSRLGKWWLMLCRDSTIGKIEACSNLREKNNEPNEHSVTAKWVSRQDI